MTTYPEVTASPLPAPAAEPSRTSTRVDWAPVPKVNLLPPEIVEGRRLTKAKRLLGGMVVLVAAGCAGGVVWAQGQVSSAQEVVDLAQARAVQLQGQQAKYAEVPRITGLIDTATTARQTAMAQDVLWYGFFSDLSLTTPKGVSLLTLQVALNDSSAPAQQGGPLAPGGIGHVSFSGTAEHFPDVASWIDAVATLHGLDGSTLQTATRNAGAGDGSAAGGTTPAAGAVTFTSSVQVTSKALTHRYDRKAD
jgi:Tfp pilus assembly protein PilN